MAHAGSPASSFDSPAVSLSRTAAAVGCVARVYSCYLSGGGTEVDSPAQFVGAAGGSALGAMHPYSPIKSPSEIGFKSGFSPKSIPAISPTLLDGGCRSFVILACDVVPQEDPRRLGESNSPSAHNLAPALSCNSKKGKTFSSKTTSLEI